MELQDLRMIGFMLVLRRIPNYGMLSAKLGDVCNGTLSISHEYENLSMPCPIDQCFFR